MSEMIKVLIVKPDQEPQECLIKNTLEEKQRIVGGWIQMVPPVLHDDTAVIICNEEGKLEGLPINRPLKTKDGEVYDVICGDFIVLDAPIESEDFASLSDEQIAKYKQMYM